jgi:hypothetical protein
VSHGQAHRFNNIARTTESLYLPLCQSDAQDQKAAGDRFVGTWAGKWEGGGSSGNIEVAISKDSEKLVGKVSANTDNGDYNAAFKSLSFDGNKMTAVYDLPSMDNVEITSSQPSMEIPQGHVVST